MMTPLPETVQSILGENATRDLARWLEDAMREGHIPREEWNDARTRLANVDRDVDGLKVAVAQLAVATANLQTLVVELRADIKALQSDMNARFDRMNETLNDRFDSMNQSFNDRFDRMNESFNDRFDSMNQSFNDRFDRQEARMARQTRWAIGLVGLMSTSVTVLLAIQTLAPGG